MARRPKETVIVIDRHGTTAELSGWRRLVAIGAGYLVLTLVTLAGLALFLGLAMTVAMVLLVAVPLAVVLMVIAYAAGYLKVDSSRSRF